MHIAQFCLFLGWRRHWIDYTTRLFVRGCFPGLNSNNKTYRIGCFCQGVDACRRFKLRRFIFFNGWENSGREREKLGYALCSMPVENEMENSSGAQWMKLKRRKAVERLRKWKVNERQEGEEEGRKGWHEIERLFLHQPIAGWRRAIVNVLSMESLINASLDENPGCPRQQKAGRLLGQAGPVRSLAVLALHCCRHRNDNNHSNKNKQWACCILSQHSDTGSRSRSSHPHNTLFTRYSTQVKTKQELNFSFEANALNGDWLTLIADLAELFVVLG